MKVERRVKCIIKDCGNEGTQQITIWLPERLDPETAVAESERKQDVWVCDGHPELMVTVDGYSITP